MLPENHVATKSQDRPFELTNGGELSPKALRRNLNIDSRIFIAEDATIVLIPNVNIDWQQFVEETPPGSFAIDGFVNGPTSKDLDTLHFNYDHHHGERDALRSACMQVFEAVKEGVISKLLLPQEIQPIVYLNHIDQDSSLAAYILSHYPRYEGGKWKFGFS